MRLAHDTCFSADDQVQGGKLCVNVNVIECHISQVQGREPLAAANAKWKSDRADWKHFRFSARFSYTEKSL